MVLIAHLATHGGARTPLSDVADRVFRGLVDELEAQSLSHKVIADMFGLRTYYDRVKRLTECATMLGRPLWEALYQYVQYQEKATRDAILSRFRNDDDAIVRAVLHDLTQSGLLAKHGRGVRTTYSIVTTPDVDQRKTLAALIEVALFHQGETDARALAASLGAAEDAVADALAQLVHDGRAEAVGAQRYRVAAYLIPASDPAGFETAVLDHVQAFIGDVGPHRRAPRAPAGRALGAAGRGRCLRGRPRHAGTHRTLSFFVAARTSSARPFQLRRASLRQRRHPHQAIPHECQRPMHPPPLDPRRVADRGVGRGKTGNTGGESHWSSGWLSGCVSDAECTNGYACIDHICSVACETNEACIADDCAGMATE